VQAIAQLTSDEASSLGAWQVRLSQALHAVTGCAKTYVAQFAESAGFHHVHFHVVPRHPALDESLRGPSIFTMLAAGATTAEFDRRRDAVSSRLNDYLNAR
jgi:diadenosine tetraphosphate (Ap4A) HIT family hydrolase